VSARAAFRTALAAALLACAAVLLAAPKPWSFASGPGFFARDGDPLHEVVWRALWWSAIGVFAICTALLASVPLWSAPLDARRRAAPAPARPAWLAPLLLAAVVLGGAIRFELYTGGVWWDEAWLVRRIVVGEMRPPPALDGSTDGTARFHRAPWIRTLFDYAKPTNHLPQSAASRVAVDAWRALSGGAPESFDERALRLPTYAASLATIALLGLLVASWGFPRAGVAAAFLLAIQTWHVETATGARGFAFVGFAAVASALALTRALRTGGFVPWAAYAAAQTLLLWTHMFAIYLTACFGVASVVSLALGRRWHEATRAIAAHLFAGAATLAVLGPAIAQFPLWQDVHTAHEHDTRSPVDLARRTLSEVWTNASLGLSRLVPQTDPERVYPSLDALRPERPLLRPTVRYVLPLLALAGLAALLARRGPQRAVVSALAAAPFLAVAVSAVAGHLGQRFHPRYLFFVLALVPPLLAVGTDAIAARLGGARHGPRAAAAALAALVLAIAWLVAPAIENQATHPYAGMRGAAQLVLAQPDGARALRVGIGLGGDSPRVYDPAILHVETASELRGVLSRARAEMRPLYVLYGHSGRNRKNYAEVFPLLDDPALFEPLGRFESVAPEFVYRVLRYTGGALEGVRPPPEGWVVIDGISYDVVDGALHDRQSGLLVHAGSASSWVVRPSDPPRKARPSARRGCMDRTIVIRLGDAGPFPGHGVFAEFWTTTCGEEQERRFEELVAALPHPFDRAVPRWGPALPPLAKDDVARIAVGESWQAIRGRIGGVEKIDKAPHGGFRVEGEVEDARFVLKFDRDQRLARAPRVTVRRR
jgi:hypothetical protein